VVGVNEYRVVVITLIIITVAQGASESLIPFNTVLGCTFKFLIGHLRVARPFCVMMNMTMPMMMTKESDFRTISEPVVLAGSSRHIPSKGMHLRR